MRDKPSSVELLEALAVFLRDEAAPRLDGGLRFKAIVGANVAQIVAREIALSAAQDLAHFDRLVRLLGVNGTKEEGTNVASAITDLSRELCHRIEIGEFDTLPRREELLRHLRACVNEKLAIDNPKILDEH